MRSADLVIKNGMVATSGSLLRCAVASIGGRVSWVGSNANAPRGDEEIDASGLIVLPGVIDVHVHMRDPGYTYKEDFRSGTAAAAAGGVTTIFDMPNNAPPTSDLAALASKAREAGKKALVDYAFYGLLAEGNSGQIGLLARAGVIGFKWYMAETTGAVRPPPLDEVRLELAMARKAGRRVSVHAEDEAIIRERTSVLKRSRRTDALAHFESRPDTAEAEAVRRASALARQASCNLHIAHLSSAAGAEEVGRAKRSRRDKSGITAETCPQYLLLDSKDYPRLGSLMKCNPPIKTRRDRIALWKAISEGTIDMIATDHAPHTLEEKTSGASIFEQASGFPGLETSVALMLTSVNRGLLTLSRYVELASEAPARAWGLYPKKGRISVGSDADFTLVDAKKEWRIDASRFVSKARYSPFDGFKAKGAPVYAVVRGGVVMDHGHLNPSSRGQMQRPLPRSGPAGGRSR